MLKLCSNGVQFRTHFTLHLKRVFLYSTSSQTDISSSSMVDFMVKSLGFSRAEAITSWKKVSNSNHIKSSENPNLVVDFLKQKGFSNTQMKKLISSLPILLKCRVDRTLIPKFNALEKLGVSGSDLADVVATNSSILRRDFTNRILPMISYMKSIVGSNKKFLNLLKRSYWLMSVDIAAGLQPNIELFRKYGFSDEKIMDLLVIHAELFGHDPKRLEEIFKKVDEELGIPPEASTFASAVVLLASLSEKTLETKCEIFKSFGWTDCDIKTMIRKAPRCLNFSETTIRERLNFFMNELGCQPGYVADRSYVMTYSMKDRVLPRYTILQVLKERKLYTGKAGIVTVVCSCESLFLKRFVLPYEDKLPELCTAYICRVKGTSTS
ncbi:hypothetical protein SOVF_136300 [Spinacia oleracea]|uniref:Transcription termination factor MTERF4, chloroplastic-like isoform X1 n=1 Tax=Spinacia oleracea TaxID=3562 RepID=A0ABM3QT15_SPIOL|nr:transcription termination factor MTERF4, chloroplastic-like isoform X1 [Spinacia oleracea]XP_056686505.1 transcription termination factor MTERF4, chloroplastic-like isoform X1 [Spinacia oleracea]XP_056686506.1 transcription termination factor MTERF4, chloroplastic-like isoform X1 [Spinacia oleracea]KNA11306.1 hypothetical protein SOVF_136300 [Spinacia oleracea]